MIKKIFLIGITVIAIISSLYIFPVETVDVVIDDISEVDGITYYYTEDEVFINENSIIHLKFYKDSFDDILHADMKFTIKVTKTLGDKRNIIEILGFKCKTCE